MIVMEIAVSNDDSCDQDSSSLKNQLTEYGLEEDNLSKEEMINLLKALKYSKEATVERDTIEENIIQKKKEDSPGSIIKTNIMKRRYINVRDRRLPWSLIPKTLEPAEKARTLAVYIKLMSMNNYRQARLSVNMTNWSPPIQIMESTRIQPFRSTRSGRSVPLYTDLDDDDSSDFDSMVIKTKKSKILNNENNDFKRGLSLKRKLTKDENLRPIKEARVINEIQETKDNSNFKIDFYSTLED